MLEVLKKSFPSQYTSWESKFKEMIPALGTSLNSNPALAAAALAETAKTLKLS
jgi:malate dehydrogenase (quinone)